jgi:hypothetical protein
MSPGIRPLRDLSAVRAYVRAHFEVVRDEPSWIGLHLERPRAWIKVVDENHGVTVLSSACKARHLRVRDPGQLIGKSLVAPTLVERDGLYLVYEQRAYAELTTPLLDEMLWFVARSTASIREAILRATGVLEVAEPLTSARCPRRSAAAGERGARR